MRGEWMETEASPQPRPSRWPEPTLFVASAWLLVVGTLISERVFGTQLLTRDGVAYFVFGDGFLLAAAGCVVGVGRIVRGGRQPEPPGLFTVLGTLVGLASAMFFGLIFAVVAMFSSGPAIVPESTPITASSKAVHLLTLPRVRTWRPVGEPGGRPGPALEVRRSPGAPDGVFLFARGSLRSDPLEQYAWADPAVRFNPAHPEQLEPVPWSEWEKALPVSSEGVECTLSNRVRASGCSPGGRYETERQYKELEHAMGFLDGPPVTLQSERLELRRVADDQVLAVVEQQRSRTQMALGVSWVGDDGLLVLWEDHPLLVDPEVENGPARVVWIDLHAADPASH
jgi:hypothetical protein